MRRETRYGGTAVYPGNRRHLPEADHPLLSDIVAPGIDVLFVGAAPSLHAAETGHYYAGPRNRFWLLLYQAGFTPRQLEAEEDRSVVEYGIGLTAVHHRVASSVNNALPEPTDEQRAAVRDLAIRLRPLVVCANGKDVYRMLNGVEAPDWGLQPERIGASRVFVVHSSSGRADRWGADRLQLYRELRQFVQTHRCSR